MDTATLDRTEAGQIAREASDANLPATIGARARAELARQPIAKVYAPKIAKSIIAVTRAIGHVAKNGKNDFQKYTYPKWEDVNEKLSPLLADNGLVVVQTEQSRSLLESNDQGSVLAIVYHFTLVNEDGEAWPEIEWTAIARLRDQKGITDDKAAAKCHTQGEKYFCLKTFKIRIGEELDGDKDDGMGRGHNQPAVVTVARGGAVAWQRAFLAAIRQAAHGETLDEWIEVNEQQLEKLKGADNSLYLDTLKAIEAHRRTMNPPTPPEQPATPVVVPTPPAETNNDTREAPPGLRPPTRKPAKTEFAIDMWLVTLATECKDKTPAQLMDLREKMIDPMRERVGPEGFSRAEKIWDAARKEALLEYPPSSEAHQWFDADQWYRDLEGAISGCTSAEQVFDVQNKVQKPAADKVSKEHYAKGKKVVAAALMQLANEG